MTAANFPLSLLLLLKSEGGNDDDPADSGGRTSRGVTQREYDAYRTREELPLGDVWHATDSEVKQIYHDSYWSPRSDWLPVGLDYLYFDMSVLQGQYKATQILQRALDVPDDGHIGIVTRTALANSDIIELIHKVAAKRRRFFQSLRQPRFIRGWLNRADRVEKEAISMRNQL